MAINTITQFLDNLYTTTWQNRMTGVADNVFNATPFWFWLKDKGKMKPQRGGRFIEESLEYASNGNIAWVDKGSTVTLNNVSNNGNAGNTNRSSLCGTSAWITR